MVAPSCSAREVGSWWAAGRSRRTRRRTRRLHTRAGSVARRATLPGSRAARPRDHEARRRLARAPAGARLAARSPSRARASREERLAPPEPGEDTASRPPHDVLRVRVSVAPGRLWAIDPREGCFGGPPAPAAEGGSWVLVTAPPARAWTLLESARHAWGRPRQPAGRRLGVRVHLIVERSVRAARTRRLFRDASMDHAEAALVRRAHPSRR